MSAHWKEWLDNLSSKQFANVWAVPTVDAEQIEQKITELRTVKGWLELQTNFLQSTIHALEVQHKTLLALHSLNLSPEQVQAAVLKAGTENNTTLGEVLAPMQKIWGESAEKVSEDLYKIFPQQKTKPSTKTPASKKSRNANAKGGA